MKNLRWLILVSIVILMVNAIQGAAPGKGCDGNTGSVPISTIDETNHFPSTQNDTIILIENNSVVVPVLVNDSGLDDGGLVLKTVYNPVFGNAIVNTDNTITYVPEKDYSGIDMISYEVCDVNSDCSMAYIIIIITVNGTQHRMEEAATVVTPGKDENIN